MKKEGVGIIGRGRFAAHIKQITKVSLVLIISLVAMACVESATDWSAPVSDDHIQPLSFEVPDWPPYEELVFEFEFFHEESEKIYNDDGSWGCGYCGAYGGEGHPLCRDTARRVLGYIDAYHVTGREIYKQRAQEGLDYLVQEQLPDGQWKWWYGPGGRTGGTSSLYVTSIPAVALIEGYKLFNNQSYLNAARKACDYLRDYPQLVAWNANYDLFAAWALATYYELTGEQSYLDRAISFALSGINTPPSYQLPSGGWSDAHNQEIWYHGIITRGFVVLHSVMPEENPNYADIQEATYKAMNHLRLRQTENGLILTYPSDTSSRTWSSQPAQAISMAVMQLNLPMEDSLRLTAKGLLILDSIPSSNYDWMVAHGDFIMAIGSLLKASAEFDTGPGTYPSIFGTHRGKITPSHDIYVSRMYMYPCAGTGGHSESVKIYNDIGSIEANWNGYRGDYIP